jgi:hypothetical protein
MKESLPVLVISKKPHRIGGFHENLENRSQAGFWVVILFLQFGIWVSGPRQTDGQDLGFKTWADRHMRSGFQDLDKQTDAQTN